jgi:hypothetical protein
MLPGKIEQTERQAREAEASMTVSDLASQRFPVLESSSV